MITKNKVIETFCIIDEFDKNLTAEPAKSLQLPTHDGNGKRYRNRKGGLSESGIMTILVCYHFGMYINFKEYCPNCICGLFRQEFPDAVSYNRFVELMPRVFFKMMMFMKLYAFGKCSGISFADSTMIPVCHNVRRYFNKVFKGPAKVTRHRSIPDFMMNPCLALTACCFFDNKPEALPVHIEKTRQLELFAY